MKRNSDATFGYGVKLITGTKKNFKEGGTQKGQAHTRAPYNNSSGITKIRVPALEGAQSGGGAKKKRFLKGLDREKKKNKLRRGFADIDRIRSGRGGKYNFRLTKKTSTTTPSKC